MNVVKSTPVSYSWLKNKLPDGAKIYKYKQLAGRARSELFKNTIGVIVLISKGRRGKEGHYIVLVPKRNHLEYFSSLGNSFEEESKLLGADPSIFQELLGNNFIYNRVKLQKNKYTIQDCAVFCLLRLKFHKMKLREFTNLFSRKVILEGSDDIASCLGLTLII